MPLKRLLPLILLLLLVGAGITYATLEYLEIVEYENQAEAKVERLIPIISNGNCSFSICLLVKDSIMDLEQDPWVDYDHFVLLKKSYEKCAMDLWKTRLQSLHCDSLTPSKITTLNDYHQLHGSNLVVGLKEEINITTTAFFSMSSISSTMATLEGQIKGMKHNWYDDTDWASLKVKLESELAKVSQISTSGLACPIADYNYLKSVYQDLKNEHHRVHLEYLKITSGLVKDHVVDCSYLPPSIIPSSGIAWSNYAEYKAKLASFRPKLCVNTLSIWPV